MYKSVLVFAGVVLGAVFYTATAQVQDIGIITEIEEKMRAFPYSKQYDPQYGVICYRYQSSISCVKK